MHVAAAIAFVGALIFLAHLLTAIFDRTRIPDVLGLILIGLVVGPFTHLVNQQTFGKVGPVFTTVTLVLLLFEGGADLAIETLRKSLKETLTLTILGFTLTVLVVAAVMWQGARLDPVSSLMVGAIIGGTSPAVIIPLSYQLGMGERARAILFLESALGDLLSIVIALALLQTRLYGGVSVGGVVGRIVFSLLTAIVLGVISALVWSVLLGRVRSMEHSLFTTAAFLFVVYGGVESLGASGPVAALAFGFTMGNTHLFRLDWLENVTLLEPMSMDHRERTFLSEVVFLLKTFFFVYVGLSIEFANFRWMSLAMVAAGLIFLIRPVVARLGLELAVPQKDATRVAAMAPKGLAAAVLASLPLGRGMPGGQLIQNVVYAIILFTVVLTALVVFLQDVSPLGTLYRFVFRSFPAVSPGELESPAPSISRPEQP
jgi:NhaP-type Na+/H+ or K+/H+ antiporter